MIPEAGGMTNGLRQAAWLLVTGGLLSFIGGCWPPWRQWSAPLEEGLRVIAAHPKGWTCIHIGFVTGTWISVLGLTTLAWTWRGTDAGAWAAGAAGVLAVASVFWTTNIAIRLGVTPWAARELVATGTIPASYAWWRLLASRCFAVFIVLAYLAVAATGMAALRSGAVSRALAWTLVIWGISAGGIFGAVVPLLAFVPYLILGGALLSLIR